MDPVVPKATEQGEHQSPTLDDTLNFDIPNEEEASDNDTTKSTPTLEDDEQEVGCPQ